MEEEGGLKLDENQLSWFGKSHSLVFDFINIKYIVKQANTFISASIPTFATIPTCVLGGIMGHHFGRRSSLLMIAPLYFTGFMCQAVAPDVSLLLFGRFVTGAAGGLASSICGVQ